VSTTDEDRATIANLQRSIEGHLESVLALTAKLDAFRTKCPGCRCRLLPGEACWCCEADVDAPDLEWCPPSALPTAPMAPTSSALVPSRKIDLGAALEAATEAAGAASEVTTEAVPPCRHPRCTPAFDEAAASGLSVEEVRRRWPRFCGPCPDCGASVIHYASTAHYVLGDW
jgi:hypothetical protein